MKSNRLKISILTVALTFAISATVFSAYALTDTSTFLSVLKKKKPKKTPRKPHAYDPKFDKIYGYGIDLSHHNPEPQWEKLETDFVILKATEGTSYVDNTFHKRLEKCKKHKIPVGAYHFFTGRDNPQKEFDNFYKTIGHKTDIIPVLDAEIMPKQKKLTKKAYQEKLKHFLQAFKKKYGCLPIIYTSEGFYMGYIKDVLKENFINDDVVLWLGDVKMKYENYIKAPHLHQTIGTVKGIKGKVDVNELHCPLDEILIKKD